MSACLNGNLVHFWIAFMLIVGGGVWCVIRRLARRLRMARGERN